jgi:hypothetical protein
MNSVVCKLRNSCVASAPVYPPPVEYSDVTVFGVQWYLAVRIANALGFCGNFSTFIQKEG